MGQFCSANFEFASHQHKLKVCATTSVVRYVPEAGLSKCPNILKVHYIYQTHVSIT